jgi:ABC-type amino acid transport system permease subunit
MDCPIGTALNGILTTLHLAVLSDFAVLLGIFSGCGRFFRPLRAVASVYVEFFRNMPFWLAVFWYFGPRRFP